MLNSFLRGMPELEKIILTEISMKSLLMYLIGGNEMKRMILLFIILMMSITPILCDSFITRGPDVGEIYFLGPTVTGKGLYHSTDFGESANCMDNTLNTSNYITTISADITPGIIYGHDMFDALYVSENYGEEGSWILRNSGVSSKLCSGVTEGRLYDGYWKHSEDYGYNFTQHSYNGVFGQFSSTAIDIDQNISYVTTKSDNLMHLFISYDNFENFEIQHIFNWNEGVILNLTRGAESGELYFVRSLSFGDVSLARELWYSEDYGENWEFKNYIRGIIVGGRQSGEIYTIASYELFLGEIRHTYIYHSVDYGETFTEYHPFAFGPEPYWSDFDVDITTGEAPLTVQFTDTSYGDEINAWEWDFDLDGIIDSYEQNPEYTYQDTGCYNVELKIYFYGEFRGYVKRNYIHVTAGNANSECKIENVKCKIQNYPNPFNPCTTISFSTTEDSEDTELNIYNMKGQRIRELRIKDEGLRINSVVWDGSGFASGIYFYKLNIENSPINKMILLK